MKQQQIKQLPSLHILLRGSLKLFRLRLQTLLGISLIDVAVFLSINQLILPQLPAPRTFELGILEGLLMSIGVVVSIWSNAALIACVAHGKKIDTFAALHLGVKRLLPLLIFTLLSVIGTVIGLLLLIIPGLIIMTLWSLGSYAIVLHKDAPIAAIRRSTALIRPYFWPVFGRLLYLAILGLAIWVALFSLIQLGIAPGKDVPELITVSQALVGLILTPFGVCYGYLLFRSLQHN